MPNYIKLTISDVQLVLIFGQKLEVHRIVFFHPHDEEAKSLFKFIREDVKYLVVFIVNNFFNETDSEQLIQINLLFGFEVEVDTIFWGC